jgi:deoxyadenosine/deoxycytidine kinase
VDIDKNKFPENEEHLGEIITRIDSQLYGLF